MVEFPKGTGGFIQPEKVLAQLGIEEGMKVADFGCGHGHFTIPLAGLITKGQVYALDVLKEPLGAIENKAKLEGLSNIKTIRCNLEMLGSSHLTDDSMDMVFMRNILFQSQEKSSIIKEAKRILKKGGQLVLIEWLVGTPLTPQEGWLISREESQKLVEAEGLALAKELDLDTYHYGLVFTKS